jgi:hypothetical protein
MPQALLPMIPHGATQISDLISVVRQDDQWTYFCGVQPVFEHPENDRRSFRMFTSFVAKARAPRHRSYASSESPRTASFAASPSIAKNGLTGSTDLAEAVARRS